MSKRKNQLKVLIVLVLILIFNCCSHAKPGGDNAEFELKDALKGDPSQDNVVDNKKLLIKNNETAIKIAEPILFGIYGEDQIEDQKPYEIHLIDNYYVINGTLMWGEQGGTFLIIIDGRNAKVLKITHYK
ncbi:YbbC/YhhH family protein [Flavobacterium chilense]|uniref:NTF2 fold immunity protein n=1 Tax=Flavobacterium chilense TaxID=946677 RepID=A0A1M7J8D4_9FLAO|nr:YbbC/YhhH family protein [Flavobacterium chilense]SHM49242.1 NTF2 fold immunity protein [Flavobacterium chilense]